MTESRSFRHRFWALALPLVLIAGPLLAPARAHAAGLDPTGADGEGQSGPSPEKTLGDYFQDLDGDNAGDRLAAARVLRGMLRRTLRRVDEGREGTLAWDEARSVLFELEERIPPACLSALEYDNVVAPCAEMLAMLDVDAAVEPLRARAASLPESRRAERVQAALTALEANRAALPPAAAPTAPPPPAPSAGEPAAPLSPPPPPTPAAPEGAATGP